MNPFRFAALAVMAAAVALDLLGKAAVDVGTLLAAAVVLALVDVAYSISTRSVVHLNANARDVSVAMRKAQAGGKR